jgi:UDP-2,3-diacylglucosamine hydrolase
MWMKDYFQQELNIPVYFEPKAFTLYGKQVLIGHGDGLGPGDHGYKFIKKLFRNRIAQTLFGWLPPVIGIGLANYFSRKSRAKTGQSDEVFESEEKEWLVSYCRDVLKTTTYEYFVFGHRHLPLDIKLTENSTYINLGDWIKYDSYAMMDESGLHLQYYKP